VYMKIKRQMKKWTQNKTYRQSNFVLLRTTNEPSILSSLFKTKYTYDLNKPMKRGTNLAVNYFREERETRELLRYTRKREMYRYSSIIIL